MAICSPAVVAAIPSGRSNPPGWLSAVLAVSFNSSGASFRSFPQAENNKRNNEVTNINNRFFIQPSPMFNETVSLILLFIIFFHNT